MSAGTPAGYCLSQMRSMVVPLRIQCPGLGRGVFSGSIEQSGSR
jgi:hypothetical protein